MSTRRTVNRHRWLLGLPLLLAILTGGLIGANVESLDGWGSLLLLTAAAGLSAFFLLLLSLKEWRRPFRAKHVQSLLGLSNLSLEEPRDTMSPVEVEAALRRRLGEWARNVSDSEAAVVLFHRSSHADYDLRIVNEDGEQADRWVCLIQAKARPVPSTLRHLARVREREDAQEAVLVTVPINWRARSTKDLLELAKELDIWMTSFDALDQLLQGRHPTIEVYVDAPPAAEAFVASY